MTGPEMLPSTRAAVLIAVHRLHRPTVREIMAAVGLSSTSTVHRHLQELRAAGLIDWQDGKRGTLRGRLSLAAVDRSWPSAATETTGS